MTDSNHRRPCRREDVNFELEADEAVLYNAATESVLHCNETAALVWQLCDGHRTVDDIIALIAGAYPDASEETAADVHRVIAELVKHHFIDLHDR